ncbi:class F sortase [Streptomyces inhibens]|uniref:Class F sortase n=1 Tax=Streptomyces inhibens TaxID=2293571 RepID=A0A371PWZ0_STRIH|nr:class F sortase [Streptomyces inhibens]REK87000.1 class F sortase [Streptomyces inhibens]
MTAQQSPQRNTNPPRTAPASRPIGRGLLWSAAAFLLGSLLVYNSVDTSADPKPQSHSAVAVSATPRATSSAAAQSPGLALSRSAPKRLSIPEIAVDAPFTPLTIGPTGQLNAPPPNDRNLVGWYKDGASPGERGSAILAGHVDTKTGPAVFLQLESLKPGSTVNVTREDGLVATFKVDTVETFNKANFPSDRVYADAPTAQLRIITCGGAYDRKVKDYVDNIVVFAHLASFRRA